MYSALTASKSKDVLNVAVRSCKKLFKFVLTEEKVSSVNLLTKLSNDSLLFSKPKPLRT